MKTKSLKCSFENTQGHTLDGRLDLPVDADNIKAFIIFCHCFTCSKETITTFRLSRLLAENGYAVLRFDFEGLGNSEGEFSVTTFSTTQDDLDCAIDYLKKNYRAPSYLMGHSLGGTTALSVAQKHEEIKAVVTVASLSKPKHVLHHFGHALTLLEQNIPASFEVAGQFYDIEPEFVDDVRSIDMKKVLSELTKPVLIFNIENDALVDENNAKEIQQWVKAETQLITIKNSDHLLSDKKSVSDVAAQIIDWLESHSQIMV